MYFSPILFAALVAAAPSVRAPNVIEITNVAAKRLSSQNLTWDFDVLDITAGKAVHCFKEWIPNDRVVAYGSCNDTSYHASIDTKIGAPGVMNIENWYTNVAIDESTIWYEADVATGTPDYTCGTSGTEGILAACFTPDGVKIATTPWSILGSV